MTLIKVLCTSKTFHYLKNLWYIDLSITNHVCISQQHFLNYYFVQKPENIWIRSDSVAIVKIHIVHIKLKK